MPNPTKNRWPATLLRRVVVRALRNNRALWIAAGMVALTMSSAAHAADGSVGAVRITDQNSSNSVAPVSGSYAAPQECFENGAPMGPVLELTGNPITDWYRVHRFERKLEKQCREEDMPRKHHHSWMHGNSDCRHGACQNGACQNGACQNGTCPNGACRNGACYGSNGACQGGPGACDGSGCDGNCGPGCDGCPHGCLGYCCLANCLNGYGCRFLDIHCYHMTYPINPWYFDRRDAQVYAAAGFGAPMVVPLAPTVQNQWNYGWGIPSSRLTPISRITPQPDAIVGAVAPR